MCVQLLHVKTVASVSTTLTVVLIAHANLDLKANAVIALVS